MDQLINDFINCRKIAVVGCSASSSKFGNVACKELKKRGCEIFVIYPGVEEIDGNICYPNLTSVREQVDGVFISVHPAKVIPLLEEIAELGLKNIWLQQGSNSKEIHEAIVRLKLPVVVDKCILMYAPPVTSIHRFHRGINQLFGKL